MSEFIAEAQVLVRPNLADFATTLRTQLTTAVAAAGPVVVPIVAAPVAGSAASSTAALVAAQREATASTVGLASETTFLNSRFAEQAVILDATTLSVAAETAALEAEGIAASTTAAAQRKLAAAEAVAARHHEQAARGVAAQTLTLLGLRGATLAASGAFLAGAGAAIALQKSIKNASDLNEELNKTTVTFGESADAVKKFAETAAGSLGIARVEALRAAGEFGNLLEPLGFGRKAAAEMSIQLVKTASDLASFHNADPSDMLERLRAGLAGQSRPLRIFGIQLLASRVNAEALIETGKKLTGNLTEQEKVTARFNLILKDSANAQGDYARTSKELANASRTLAANISNLSDDIGQLFLPALRDATNQLNDMFRGFELARKGAQELQAVLPIGPFFISPPTPESSGIRVFGILKGVAQDLGGVFSNLGLRTRAWADELKAAIASGNANRIVAVLGAMGQAGAAAGKGLDTATEAIKRNAEAQAAAQHALATPATRVQAQIAVAQATGDVATERELRRQRLATNRAALEREKQARQTAHTVRREKELSALITQDQNRLADIAQDAADKSKDAADRIKRAAEDQATAAEAAQRARTDAVNAIAERFTARSDALEHELSRSANEGFKRQIAINRLIVANDLKEISVLRARIRHLNLHGEALKAARAAIQSAQREIDDARDAIADATKARNQAIQDILNQKLDLRIQIAQAQGNVAAEIRARRAKLDEITKELVRAKRASGKNSLAWLELKAAQAEEIAAIKDLEGTAKEKQNAQKSLFFTFLQTQQGFAANLLGNLIPGFATRGLVGGSTPAAATAAFDTGRRPAAEAAVATGRERGVRPVQVDTTNHLLRQILRSLQNLNGRATHPEARYQKQASGGMMDTL